MEIVEAVEEFDLESSAVGIETAAEIEICVVEMAVRAVGGVATAVSVSEGWGRV